MRSIASVLPILAPTPEAAPAAIATRFTLDGDGALEAHLARTAEAVRAGIAALIPSSRLEGLLLGGGYGRGEGGVWRTARGDRPYNDLEFYVLARGSVLLNERRYRAALGQLAHELGAEAGLEVEFKLLSLARLRRSPVSMFSCDLIRGHRWVSGDDFLLHGCAHHERAERIPLAEAARLLMNRCSGLLFARHRLARDPFTADDADFAGRNLAKARLALGDVLLTARGRYHWSCRERQRRLETLPVSEQAPWFDAVRLEHARGAEFKLHPRPDDRPRVELLDDLRQLSLLACQVWLWLERHRLRSAFRSPADYLDHPASKCPETSPVRNWLVNVRHFGRRGAWRPEAFRYPRERLLRSLPVLLWQPALVQQRPVLTRLQRELRTNAADEAGLLPAYVRIWEIFR